MNAVVDINAQLTFKNEGQNVNENHPFYTLKPHHPDSNSGVTIGKGYDMKLKSAQRVKDDLIAAGVDATVASKLSEGAGLSGTKADEFVEREDIAAIRITKENEATLFNIVYQEKESYAKRLCQKDDVQDKYGTCDWHNIDKGIRSFVTDLAFRGDYSGSERKHIQTAVITNDYDTLIKIASDKTKWKNNLDNNRFTARILHLKTSKNLFDVQNSAQKLLLP